MLWPILIWWRRIQSMPCVLMVSVIYHVLWPLLIWYLLQSMPSVFLCCSLCLVYWSVKSMPCVLMMHVTVQYWWCLLSSMCCLAVSVCCYLIVLRTPCYIAVSALYKNGDSRGYCSTLYLVIMLKSGVSCCCWRRFAEFGCVMLVGCVVLKSEVSCRCQRCCTEVLCVILLRQYKLPFTLLAACCVLRTYNPCFCRSLPWVSLEGVVLVFFFFFFLATLLCCISL